VCVDDIDVYQLDAERLADFRREYLGFVFQSLFLVPYLTALQNVMLPLAAARLPESRQQTMAMDALERVGLSRKAGRLPHDLSGGEPTGCLDSETGHSIIQLFRRLQEQGLSVFMVTHDAGVASCADRVLALRDGLLMSSCGDVTKEVVGARS
jgi:putative ABC transport system ATP-binding protein